MKLFYVVSFATVNNDTNRGKGVPSGIVCLKDHHPSQRRRNPNFIGPLSPHHLRKNKRGFSCSITLSCLAASVSLHRVPLTVLAVHFLQALTLYGLYPPFDEFTTTNSRCLVLGYACRYRMRPASASAPGCPAGWVTVRVLLGGP